MEIVIVGLLLVLAAGFIALSSHTKTRSPHRQKPLPWYVVAALLAVGAGLYLLRLTV